MAIFVPLSKMKKNIQTLTLVFGLILAIAIVCAQVFSFQAADAKGKVVKTEQNQKKSEQSECVISAPSISLPSSSNVTPSLEVYYLFEIIFEAEVPAVPFDQCKLQPQKLFRTLFSVIISPNAP